MRGFNDLEVTYDTTQFLPMTFYFGAAYSIPEGNARATWYGLSGTPNVMFGGTHQEEGGLPSGSMYSYYNPTVSSQMASSSPLIMSSSYIMTGGSNIELTLEIEVDQALSGTNNQVHFFVCQEGLHDQTSMVVDMLAAEPFNLSTPGQTVTINRTFPMDPAWNQPDLRVIMVVQDMSTKAIHQATLAFPDYAGQVIVAPDPAGVEAPWHLTGPDLDVTGLNGKTINLWKVGSYTITWEDIPFWTTPAVNPETQTVTEDGVLSFLGAYTDGPLTAETTGDLGHIGPGQAVSLIDFDSDGDLDIHVVNEGGTDQLLNNDGMGVFTDIAASPIAEPGAGRGAAWADATGDGFLDVLVSRNNEANVLLVGDGAGGFTTATTYGLDVVGAGSSSSWVDFDLDGDLDLYVVYEGEANTLLITQATYGTTFIFGSDAANAETADLGNGSAALWVDCDLDGRPDLFIANQFGSNVLLKNESFGFSNVTQSAGVAGFSGQAMGAAAGDYDNDGDFDLYVANEGNVDLLYRNSGSFLFTQMVGDNLGDPGEARGATWVDLDNDTFLDLYVVRNGQTDLVLMGDGAGNFVRVSVGPPEAAGPGNAVACGDVDNDGDVDVFISREGDSNVLFLNEMAGDNRWIKLRLTGSSLNSGAIGARVVLTTGGVSQTRALTAGSGYLSNNALELHFGLGTATQVDQIDIFWPDEAQTHEVMGPTSTNQTLSITQGQGISAVEDEIPLRTTSLGLAHPNPFNPSTTIDFALAVKDQARVDVFTVDGRHVRTLLDRSLDAGPHAVTWNGTDKSGRAVGSGTYFYRLTTGGGFRQAGRMVLIK